MIVLLGTSAILFGIVFLTFFIKSIHDYFEWVSNTKRKIHYTKMKLSFLRKLYRVNKKRWGTFIGSYYGRPLPLIFYKTESYTENYIYTSYLDYIKFILLKNFNSRSENKKNDLKNQTESMKRILKSSQKDIDKMRNQAQEEINKAAKINEQVKETFYTPFDLLGVTETCPTYIEKEGITYVRCYLKDDAKDTQCWYKKVEE